jgi:hypothetical protein
MSEMCALLVAASVVFGQAEAKKPVLPEKIAQQLQFFVGEWNVEGEVAGGGLKGPLVDKVVSEKNTAW